MYRGSNAFNLQPKQYFAREKDHFMKEPGKRAQARQGSSGHLMTYTKDIELKCKGNSGAQRLQTQGVMPLDRRPSSYGGRGSNLFCAARVPSS